MRNSLSGLIALAAAAVLVAALPAIVSAATFSYYESGLFSQSGAMVSNGSGTDDPGPDSSWSHEYVESFQDAETPDQVVYADGAGSGTAELNDQSLYISVDGSVDAMTLFGISGHMESYGGASTVQAGVTTGIYFQLDPEAGENIGDPVRIDFDWTGELSTSLGTTAHIDGGFAGDTIAITLNDYPAPSSFDPAKAVWTRQGNNAADGASGSWEDGGFFMAAIGDIIGIHMGAGADLNLDGEAYEIWARGSQELQLTASSVPIPSVVWLLGSGLLGLAAVRRRKK